MEETATPEGVPFIRESREVTGQRMRDLDMLLIHALPELYGTLEDDSPVVSVKKISALLTQLEDEFTYSPRHTIDLVSEILQSTLPPVLSLMDDQVNAYMEEQMESFDGRSFRMEVMWEDAMLELDDTSHIPMVITAAGPVAIMLMNSLLLAEPGMFSNSIVLMESLSPLVEMFSGAVALHLLHFRKLILDGWRPPLELVIEDDYEDDFDDDE